ncbi:L,D-transpeptidase family protein [Streptomyces sp. NPDC000151]|uniref:L,D-transpeptidase family protein n=1 Tax=Streptomyces sp. NPDC000151 TaxID=3154244 RepID=UPI003316F993
MRSTSKAAVLVAAGLVLVAGCGGAQGDGKEAAGRAGKSGATPSTGLTRIPGVGEGLQSRIPADSRQVIAVYGNGENATTSTVVLYTKDAGENSGTSTGSGSGSTWSRERSWEAHNGKRGWTLHHHVGDKRSPVGVYTLSDAGGVLPDPGAKLPYTASAAFTPPSYWAKRTRHDFDYVIAIDYNRAKGVSPLDPTRPEGESKGGGIWLHMDHGSGTSGCVSLPKSGMRYLLRTIDPAQHPVVVMGDKAHLEA